MEGEGGRTRPAGRSAGKERIQAGRRREREWERGGKLKRGELVRCRVRYFTDGLVLGSRGFVESAFEARREWFGAKRKDGARPLPEATGELFSLRALHQQAIE